MDEEILEKLKELRGDIALMAVSSSVAHIAIGLMIILGGCS
ncbi:MAG: hypothetical protein WDZ51_06200 [Pirellulaceae bacterium]